MTFRPLLLTAAFTLVAMHAHAKVFPPEIGNYKYTLSDIQTSYEAHGLDYLSVDFSREIPNARYKITKRNEYQIKKWYSHDWFDMQEMFTLDVNSYMNHYQRTSFNEAKRAAYGRLTFNKKKNLHNKVIPTPREWGGLNHPPLRTLELPLEAYSIMHGPMDHARANSAYFSPTLHTEIDEVSKSELSFGNSITILEDRAAFEAKKALIRSAKRTIFMGSLVFVCDKSSREITDLLIERHRAGIDVRVLVDGTISKTLGHTQCSGMLERAGVQIIGADDFWIYGRAIYHTKSLIVDFETSISGGHNMLDADNLSRGTDFQNRDIDILTRGPMVTDLAMAFVKDWTHFYEKYPRRLTTHVNAYRTELTERLAFERSLGLRGAQNYARILGNENTRMDGVCRYIRQSPAEDRQIIGRAVLKMLDGVQNYLVITNPVVADSRVTKLNRPLLPIYEWKDRFVMCGIL